METSPFHGSFRSTLVSVGILLILLQPSWTYIIHGYSSDVSPLENATCVNGKQTSEEECSCSPCWEGEQCTDYVDNYAPRFLVHRATAVVPVNVEGAVYRAWANDDDLGLTCPLGPGESARCPCATISYQLFASPGDRRFILDSSTGILSRSKAQELEVSKIYSYKLMAQSPPVKGEQELLYDLLDLDIYVGSTEVEKIPWD